MIIRIYGVQGAQGIDHAVQLQMGFDGPCRPATGDPPSSPRRFFPRLPGERLSRWRFTRKFIVLTGYGVLQKTDRLLSM